MPWTFEPYLSLDRIEFDLDESQVLAILGAPTRDTTKRSGRRRMEFGLQKPAVSLSSNRVVEISALPEIEGDIEYDGIFLFGDSSFDVIIELQKRNGTIFERNGFLIFFSLGLCLTGFHDDNDSQKSANFFRKNFYWEDFRSKMTEFHL